MTPRHAHDGFGNAIALRILPRSQNLSLSQNTTPTVAKPCNMNPAAIGAGMNTEISSSFDFGLFFSDYLIPSP